MSEASPAQRRQKERQRHRRRRHVRSSASGSASASASISVSASSGSDAFCSGGSSGTLVGRPWLSMIPLDNLKLTDLLFHCDHFESAFKEFLTRILSVENFLFWQASVDFHVKVEGLVLGEEVPSTSSAARSDGITSPALAPGGEARSMVEAGGGIRERAGRRVFVKAEQLFSSCECHGAVA